MEVVRIEQPKTNHIYQGDSLEVLKTFATNSVDCVVTSPPYWALRDYGVDGQLGLEPTVGQYIDRLCDVFDDVRRAPKPAGTCWVNIGDTYAGANAGSRWNTGHHLPLSGGKQKLFKLANGSTPRKQFQHGISEKSLTLVPFRFAIEMVNRGWVLRNTIIWHKPNCLPSSVKDRFTVDFEYLFFFVKSKRYWFDPQYEPFVSDRASDNIKRLVADGNGRSRLDTHMGSSIPWQPSGNGRNKRCVWSIPTSPFPEAHFAVYPEQLVEIPVEAGCPPGGIVLDPFMGSGTTAVVALKHRKHFVGIELNPGYIALARNRIRPFVEQQVLPDALKTNS